MVIAFLPELSKNSEFVTIGLYILSAVGSITLLILGFTSRVFIKLAKGWFDAQQKSSKDREDALVERLKRNEATIATGLEKLSVTIEKGFNSAFKRIDDLERFQDKIETACKINHNQDFHD